MQVRKELRGFEAEDSTLRISPSPTPQLVSITGLAARRCPTGRDLYLEKIDRISVSSWERYVLGKIVDELLVRLYEAGIEWIEKMLEDDPSGGLLAGSAVLGQMQTAGFELIDELMAGIVTDRNHRGQTIDQYADAIFGSAASEQLDRTNRLLRTIVLHEARCLVRLVKRARGNASMRLIWKALGRLPDRMGRLRATLNTLETGLHLDSNSKRKASVFGLSEGIRPDFVYGALVVGDLKVDKYHDYYNLVAAGYAIFAEYVFSRRVNNALLMFVEADLTRPDGCEIKVVPVEVNNARRVAWSTQRDSARGILRLPVVPARPTDIRFCAECPYRKVCWVNGEIGKPQ